MSLSTITPDEAAIRLGVSTATVRRWCKRGLGVRLAGRWRISEKHVAEIEQNLVCAAGMPSYGAQAQR